jgi:hypothetical protein
MGPTKVIVKGQALYDARTGKLVKDGLATAKEREDYAAHHYIALPLVDNAGRPWMLEGQPVYCLRGSRYETVDDQQAHLARCPDCGGMGIRVDELTVASDEFDARLEMMES